jgi:hypothetical protein
MRSGGTSFAVERGGEVAGVVERRAVALAQEARLLDAEFLEPDDLRAVAVLEHARSADARHRGFHLVLEERLAGDVVEGHAEARVRALEGLQRLVAQQLPHATFLIVGATLEGLEVLCRFVVERGVLLHFLRVALVQVKHVAHRRLVQFLLVAPAHVGRHHLGERHAPVAEVIDAVHRGALMAMDATQGVADHRAAHVADVERLCDVRRAEVDADRLAVLVGLAVGNGVGLDRGQHFAREGFAAEAEVDKRAGRRGGLDDGVGRDLRGEFGRECGRCLAGEFGELERAERHVAVVAVLRRIEAHHRFGGGAIDAEAGEGGEDAVAKMAVEVGHGRCGQSGASRIAARGANWACQVR